MGLALEQAREAFLSGEFPVGCVIVQDCKVVASGARAGTSDIMSRPSEIDHAEIRALRALEASGGLDISGNAVLFCTMEPCLMCFAAIMLSGIKTVVYAYEDVMGGGTGCDVAGLAPLYSDCGMTVIPGVLREESLALFGKFFMKKENRYWKDSLLERYTIEQAMQLKSAAN